MTPEPGQPPKPVHVGTSGWSYDDWRGRFYPGKAPGRFDRLAYLARYFDCVEVNSSFYRPPSPRAVASWLRRTPGDFTFTFKLHQRFTHEREMPWTPREVDAFRCGIEPVREAGRLGAVLVQFPWSFRCDEEALGHLEAVRGDFGDLPLVVEVRHASWTGESATAFLRSRGLGWANIDQPPSRSGVPPMSLVTSPVGYVRLHGRNREAWFDPKAGRDARYDYLYREDELEEWIDRVRDIARRSEKTYVFANNHYRGQAPANALQILSRLAGRRVPVPSPLLRTYPFLEQVAEEGIPPGEQGTLF
ncbi:MAG: DUF72 domain-containing protein [Gemmatimonadota bacterium]|nr:DUF72 domain-containing protein [Gemmatimonadota bacterium]